MWALGDIIFVNLNNKKNINAFLDHKVGLLLQREHSILLLHWIGINNLKTVILLA